MMTHELKRLNARHHRIADLMLTGLPRSQIAKRLEMKPRGVRNIQWSPIIQSEFARRRAIVERETDEQIALVPARARQIMEEKAADAAGAIVMDWKIQTPESSRRAPTRSGIGWSPAEREPDSGPGAHHSRAGEPVCA